MLNIDDLNQYITSLKETSNDNHNGKDNNYMTESELNVINFDKVKEKYIKNLGVSKPPYSNDALFFDEKTENYYFIEFKAGGINPMKNVEIKFKIYDSLLILLDILKESTTFSRKKIIYILVYNDTIKHTSKHFEGNNSSKNYIQNHISAKANTEIIRFDLERYKNLYFKDIHTYTIEEFEEKFIKKYSV